MAEKLTQEQKKETLENAVMCKSAAEAGEICKSFGKIHFSARALGIACRFKGIDYVKALVENGADFANRYSKVHTDLYYWRTDFAATLFDINEVLRKSNSVQEEDDVFGDVFPAANGENLTVLPRGERLKIAEYLLDNAEKCLLNTDNFLMNSILVNDREFIDLCRKKGMKFSEDYVAMLTVGNKKLTVEWSDFSNVMFELSENNFYAAITNLRQECNGELINFTDIVRIMLKSHLDNVDFFRFVLDNFNRAKMNQKAIVEDIIDTESLPCLPVVEEIGWLKMPRKRDDYIKHASDEGKTECTAWLMDFKNRTADFAAEREKAEKKMQRELNADPNSVGELKQIWTYKKQDDGTLIITSYKGSATVVTIPEKIGKDTVTAIGEYALAGGSPRATEQHRQIRKKITKITVPDTVNRIESNAFDGCLALREVNLPNGITEIASNTFSSCRSLETVKIPDSVTKIDKFAFKLCDNLKSVIIPPSVTIIENDTDSKGKTTWTVFQCSRNVTAIVEPNSYAEKYCVKNNIPYKYAAT